jgi:hypothetical protein
MEVARIRLDMAATNRASSHSQGCAALRAVARSLILNLCSRALILLVVEGSLAFSSLSTRYSRHEKSTFPDAMGNCGSIYNQQRCDALIEEPLDADPGIVGPGVWCLRSWVQSSLSDNSPGIGELCSDRSIHIRGDHSGILHKVSSGGLSY